MCVWESEESEWVCVIFVYFSAKWLMLYPSGKKNSVEDLGTQVWSWKMCAKKHWTPSRCTNESVDISPCGRNGRGIIWKDIQIPDQAASFDARHTRPCLTQSASSGSRASVSNSLATVSSAGLAHPSICYRGLQRRVLWALVRSSLLLAWTGRHQLHQSATCRHECH